MKIGEAAAASGLSVKSVRYYADIGLVAPAGRTASGGYRDYGEPEIVKLRLVRRARAFGFSIAECRALLGLFENEGRASADVKALAERKRADLEERLRELEALRRDLGALIDACAGDDGASCAILEGLAGDGGEDAAASPR